MHWRIDGVVLWCDREGGPGGAEAGLPYLPRVGNGSCLRVPWRMLWSDVVPNEMANAFSVGWVERTLGLDGEVLVWLVS